MPALSLSLLPELYAVCRLPADAPVPEWAVGHGAFLSVTRTAEELSITGRQELVPPDLQHEGGWRVLKLDGPFDLAMVGVLAPIAAALAEAQVNIFVISTYDTDYILVKETKLEETRRAIERLGHRINGH